jgi:tetratricopeptide (TPR) repeat protein
MFAPLLAFCATHVAALTAGETATGNCHRSNGNAVFEACTEAIRENPSLSLNFVYRGIAFKNKGEYKKAISDFLEVLRLSPSNTYIKNLKLETEELLLQEETNAARNKILQSLRSGDRPLRDRLDQYVQTELKQWLSPEAKDLEEIPTPSYPPALSLKQEAWETNKEFEDRVQKAREDRRQAIDKIQGTYRLQVEARNKRVADYNKARQERESGLPDKRRQLILSALEILNPAASLSDLAFDQQSGALTVSAQVEGFGKQTFAFTGTPQEFRRSAMTSPGAMKAKPVFVVSNAGELSLQAITVEAAGTSARGVPSAGVTAPVQLATVNLPAVAVPVIAQQSGATVDRNQVEQILYRDENEMLRKRLEDQRRAQEQALAGEQAKAAAEIAKLRAEADALRKQPAEVRPAMNVATVREAHALVIGNSAYLGSNSLPNPVNDAKAVSAKLRSLGFRVTEVANTSRDQMVKGLAEFSKTAANADLTLFFYAGHGVQIAGTNYMIPIDMNLNDVSQASLQAVSLNSVVEQYLPGKTKLVFLDACRDNPLMASVGRGVSKGLAPINVSEGTLISYATKDGQTAEDGVGQTNSPFTTALIEHLSDPDDIAVVLRTVRSKVMQRTNNRQQPWEYGSLTGGALVLSAIKPTGSQPSQQLSPVIAPVSGATDSQPSALRSIFDRMLKN